LAALNYNLIITGRRIERLIKIKNEIESSYSANVLILNFDVRDRLIIKEILNNIPETWKNIDVLVNNAGLASGLSLIQDGNIDDWEKMIDTNIKGLLYISREVMPLMIERQKGHIINIGSIAGKETYLKGNVYCATKHAVDSLTKAMRIDLLPHNIKVTSISPGMVETEFSEVRFGNVEAAKKVYEGFTPLNAVDIAETVEFILSRPAHVNINDILIMPAAQANSTHTHRKNV
jgi:NADP-dependent 3-hydroxy acid dehydrogenase YdfG